MQYLEHDHILKYSLSEIQTINLASMTFMPYIEDNIQYIKICFSLINKKPSGLMELVGTSKEWIITYEELLECINGQPDKIPGLIFFIRSDNMLFVRFMEIDRSMLVKYHVICDYNYINDASYVYYSLDFTKATLFKELENNPCGKKRYENEKHLCTCRTFCDITGHKRTL